MGRLMHKILPDALYIFGTLCFLAGAVLNLLRKL